MILVVNLNPSLDKIYEIDKMEYGQVMRTEQVQNTAGGKGTHVANVVKSLKEECTVVGFLGGYIGSFIAAQLEAKGIVNAMTPILAETRSCLNVVTNDGRQTEILEPGSWILEEEQRKFMDTYEKLLKEADLVVAAGSLPRNLPIDFYRQLIERANHAGKRFLLDTSGLPFMEGLKGKPFLVKPNRDEIEAFRGRKINVLENAIQEIKLLMQEGIKMPVISLGAEGSVVGTDTGIYHVLSPQIEVVNAVGSGDAYVAGLAVALKRNMEISEIIRLASACGAANVCERESGVVRSEIVEELKNRIMVRCLDIET